MLWPLWQILESSFLFTKQDDNGEGSLGNGDKSFYVGRTKILEAKIREELIQQGNLDQIIKTLVLYLNVNIKQLAILTNFSCLRL